MAPGGSSLRTFLKGWGRNIRGDYKKERDELMRQIQAIDARGINRVVLKPQNKQN
jgi:hypothetical protein